MKYKFIGKNVEVTESIKNYAVKTLDKLNKYFSNADELECRVLVRTYNVGAKAEITIYLQKLILRAEVKNDDLYAAIDLAVDKLAGQIRKLKTKLKVKHKTHFNFENIEEVVPEENEESSSNIKEKVIELEAMPVEDAILNMEALGHSFYAFKNDETKKTCIVYKRDSNKFGLIELN